ncbi:methyl-accepting chemotaxis protein [Jeotgalibacillus haloalkalitolerans]|uniref:Methyl-accepting chemotaxis protein n=1 Tax=Jeotgalibacillus haloalkalitolerans TaxID=3104292 RepID=A0ABU5KHT5_9BACL|nr:methyl-accepting chemotaxis protein [Jeotgalibacillus sp. HH7-29]MDZ5710795.1 methyl-accepting chemotaxis protein [Jeotgalibacillus sp. HH7-29]
MQLIKDSNETATNKLEAFLQVIPVIHTMLPDVGIGVVDTEKWLAYYPGRKINIGARAGRKIDPNEPLAECIRDQREIKQEVPEEFFGISFTGLAAPIIENQQVIGAIAIQIQEQNEKALREISDQIFDSINQANERITSLHSGSEGLAVHSSSLLQQSTEASEAMKNTDEVINIIKKIASQTNILGLNASIEAARAGEHGRGFNIVAKEIRKLSNDTLESTEKISSTLKQVQSSIHEIQSMVENLVTVGREQASATEEISSFIDEIEKMSAKLKTYAAKL